MADVTSDVPKPGVEDKVMLVLTVRYGTECGDQLAGEEFTFRKGFLPTQDALSDLEESLQEVFVAACRQLG